MKKSNVITFAVVAVLSIFLLWLWYYLGFNHIDHPLDLVLSILWWVVVAAAIITIIQVEKRRRTQIRTVYVAEGELFNSEKGRMAIPVDVPLTDTLEELLKDLEYDFTKSETPDKEDFATRYIVRTSKIKDDTWEGETVDVLNEDRQETEFDSKESLTAILAGKAAVPQKQFVSLA